MSFSEPKYGTSNLFRALGVFYRPSYWLKAKPCLYYTCPMTTHLARQRPRHDRCPIHSTGKDTRPKDGSFPPPRRQTRPVREAVTYLGDSHSWCTAMSTAPAIQNVWGWQAAVTLLLGPRQWRPGLARM